MKENPRITYLSFIAIPQGLSQFQETSCPFVLATYLRKNQHTSWKSSHQFRSFK